MIRLAPRDIDFMLQVLDLPDGFDRKLKLVREGQASLTADEADTLRDLCGERLQTHGFGPEYEATEEGRRLEKLIDQLYTG